jgi:hypothetical protein
MAEKIANMEVKQLSITQTAMLNTMLLLSLVVLVKKFLCFTFCEHTDINKACYYFDWNKNWYQFLIICFYLRNKSWKPECVLSFNMDLWKIVFYPEPEARDKIYFYPSAHVKTQNTFWLPWFFLILIWLRVQIL